MSESNGKGRPGAAGAALDVLLTDAAVGNPAARVIRRPVPTLAAGARVVNKDRMWHYTEGVANHDPIWAGHGIRILPGPSSVWFDALGRRLPAPGIHDQSIPRASLPRGHRLGNPGKLALERIEAPRAQAIVVAHRPPQIPRHRHHPHAIQPRFDRASLSAEPRPHARPRPLDDRLAPRPAAHAPGYRVSRSIPGRYGSPRKLATFANRAEQVARLLSQPSDSSTLSPISTADAGSARNVIVAPSDVAIAPLDPEFAPPNQRASPSA